MKKIILAVTALLLMCTLVSCHAKNGESADAAKTSAEPTKDGASSTEPTRDTEDTLEPVKVRYDAYDSDGELGWWYTYQYDAKGNLISELCYDEDGEVDRRYAYYYNEKGLNTEMRGYEGEELSYYCVYAYNDYGKEYQKSRYNASDILTAATEYEYDPDGNLITEMTKKDGVESSRVEYTYDDEGMVLTETTRENGTERRYEYEYENGVLAKSTFYRDGEEEFWNEYVYDAQGNNIKRIGHDDTEWWFEYEYDDRGNMITETRFDKGNVTFRHVYTFDIPVIAEE